MDKKKSIKAEKGLISALVTVFSTGEKTPPEAEVYDLAKILARTNGYDGPFKPIVEEVLYIVDTRMGLGVSLIDTEASHDEAWISKREDIKWTYSDAYSDYLISEKWNPNVVGKLSDVGENIVSLLQDPKSEGKWDRRGLVIGHVQSGKTANYLAVIAKAADAGFKLIIVIAGIHNNLRKQTQERIDSGFVGLSSDPTNRIPTGVGILQGQNYPQPISVTNIYDDFNKNIAGRITARINNLNTPCIMVIKKNVNTLKALHNWLRDLNARSDGKISDIPMLMIDDEADNASINTNIQDKDTDPTITNAMIRRILGLFDKSCYVGYTATPFANIFVNPDAYDEEVYEELFPKDFIYCLDAPNSYFGPDKVFLDEEKSNHILKFIRDAEEYLPFSHKKHDEILALPPSLYEAINKFLLVKTIRICRGQSQKHCSMMINASRFVKTQEAIRDFVSEYIKLVREAVKANYKMPEVISNKNEYMSALRSEFLSEFGDVEVEWPAVKNNLFNAFDTMKIIVANSKSQDSLDYSAYEKDGNGLTAIAIGGLSLSRGLTIEGLCVSYMYRNTRMYDTLMQMGRWFGYRAGYEDLCRVYLSEDSINWYRHIAVSAEELRSQIKQMRRYKLSPKDFGLYVKMHPDRLLITAMNKMRGGEKLTVDHNYSGKIRETHFISAKTTTTKHNYGLLQEVFNKRFGLAKEELLKTEKGWFLKGVETTLIENFISEFEVCSAMGEYVDGALQYLRAISKKYPLSDVLFISKKLMKRIRLSTF